MVYRKKNEQKKNIQRPQCQKFDEEKRCVLKYDMRDVNLSEWKKEKREKNKCDKDRTSPRKERY